MASEWRTGTLGSVLKGGIRHGIYKPLDEFGTGTRVLKMGLQYSEDRIGTQAMPRAPVGEKELNRYRAHEGDLLFSRTSMMSDGAGKCSLVVAHDEAFVFDGNILGGSPDTTLIVPAFLFYYFKSPAGKQAISEIIAGTQSRSLSGTNLAAVTVRFPSITEQRAIAHVLGTLDDKIELNRRMNETLEAVARTLFKSWFVDFDPARANAQDRFAGLPQPLADLFPDSFEASELEDIPAGWRVATLESFSSLNPESWSRETRPEMIEYIDLSNTKWGRIEVVTRYEQKAAPSRAQRVLRAGDTVVGTVRPGNGSFALISDSGLTGSTGFAVLRPLNTQYTEFVYLAATAANTIEALSHLADGAAYPAVRPEVVGAVKVVRPDDAVFEAFSRLTRPMLAKIARNNDEARALADLRDALLPKLVSGEFRVQEPAPARSGGD